MQVILEPRAGNGVELQSLRDRLLILVEIVALVGAAGLLGIQLWMPSSSGSLAVEATRTEVVATFDRLLPSLNHGNVSAPASGPALAELDRRVRELVLSDTLVRVKIWNRDGQVVYSDDGTLVGERFEIGHELEEALAGTLAVEAMETTRVVGTSPDRTQRLHEVYVPIVLAGETRPSGAFEVYAYVDEAVGRRTGLVPVAAALALFGAALMWRRGRQRP